MFALMPHGSCFLWNPSLTSLHVVADGLIAIAYLSIPVLLFRYRDRAAVQARPLLILFAAFILSCGFGHLLQVWNIWHSNYWLEGSEKLVTASVSCVTAVLLSQKMPQLLETQKALEVSRELAKTDPLTGLNNRRALNEAIANGLHLVQTHDIPHTLVLLDLDDFKAVNDTFGHALGDHVLVEVGQQLLHNVRALDTVARMGGDEFAVFLPGCALSEALAITHKLKEAIANIHICHPEKALYIPNIHVSIGVTSAEHNMTAEALYTTADKALYHSKKSGKDQIAWIEEGSCFLSPT
ncbi:GGDEF domain-containing protein [Leptolyngbya sp. AN02str]|uniref:GGDEF domain-containing protein n=1 Tax=Leptolyngbya sp. AN02str TaxID=3423363 RepID=UPI003D31AB4E